MKRRIKSIRIDAYLDIDRDEREQKIKHKMRLIKPPSAPTKILSQKQRAEAVKEVRKVLENWTSTPFEKEGQARAAVRSAFCEGGNAWGVSDLEAERIVGAALEEMGARRPTWEEGQWTYAISEDYCHGCQGPLEPGHTGRYCSKECADIVLTHRDLGYRGNENRAYMEARRAAHRFAMPTKACKWCQKHFHPRQDVPDQQFCSNSCSAYFKSQRQRDSAGTPKVCRVCHNPFTTKRPDVAMYCSNACKFAAGEIGNDRWQPKILTRQVWEQLVVKQAPLPPWLTPERFDEMVAA